MTDPWDGLVYLHTHLVVFLMVNLVGKYTVRPTDPMGYIFGIKVLT